MSRETFEEELLANFLENRVEPEQMSHENHLYLAWLLLRRHPLPEAMILYRDGLTAFTARMGLPDKYNETVTFAMVMLVYERMRPDQDFPAFLAGNDELNGGWRALLNGIYPDGLAFTPRAAQRFIMPCAGS